jgi:hypothetical protein
VKRHGGGSTARRAVETLLRLCSLALIGYLIWAATRPAPDGARWAEGGTATLDADLARWSASAFPDSVHLRLDRAPDPAQRAWLAALRRSGAGVAWTDAGLPALALEVHPNAGPLGGEWVLAAAPADGLLALSDGVSALDTVRAAGPGAALRVPAVSGVTEARLGAHRATAALHDSIDARAVLVLGRAGWESRFLVTALEERGWTVHARLAVAPGMDVTQGDPLPLDTAHYAAVVAVDSSAARDAPRIGRFVRMGGGLVLAGGAAAAPAFRSLAPGSVGARLPALDAVPTADAPHRGLALLPVVAPHPDAVPLEAHDGRVAAAARRVGTGRVVQVGYDETWRWRMEGPADAPVAHRAWWSEIVGAAAYRPVLPRAAPASDPSPRTATFDALGPPAPPHASAVAVGGGRWPAPSALPLLLVLLLAEWASRRLRGAR